MNSFSVNKAGVYDPRDYQNEGLSKILSFLNNSFKTGLSVPGFVEYSVGYGKTGIYAFIARYVTQGNKDRVAQGKKPFKVLIIAHQTELTRQNSEFAWKCGVPNIIVAAELNKGKNAKNMELQNVVYANEKTLDNRISSFDSKMFNNWTPDLIFIDECHRLNWKDFMKFNLGHEDKDDKPTVYTRILNYFMRKNPKVQIIGGSGSPWRDNEWIKGPFWKECIDRKDTSDLVKTGFLVPVKWGLTDLEYDYSKLNYTLDETSEKEIDLDKAEKIALKQHTTTELICAEVVEVAKHRNACLMFCSGQDHLKEVKEALLKAGAEADQIGIITESTGFISRTEILDRARVGKCKFVLNVSVLTTGVNVPLWDMLVFMRPVGSVVLFVQSTGRVLRLHDDELRELGFADKVNALVLDYAGVFERLGHMAESLSLEEAEYKKQKKSKEFRICANEKCKTKFSQGAVICPVCGLDHGEPKKCIGSGRNKGCGKMSKSTARRCEHCHTPFVDVNENLSSKHYRKHEFEEVAGINFGKPSEA